MTLVVIAAAVAESGAVVVPGFDSTAEHAAEVWVPGCSGKVVPGAPRSAVAGAAATARAATARTALMRFMTGSFSSADVLAYAALGGRP
jgi:hypothetical protein